MSASFADEATDICQGRAAKWIERGQITFGPRVNDPTSPPAWRPLKCVIKRIKNSLVSVPKVLGLRVRQGSVNGRCLNMH